MGTTPLLVLPPLVALGLRDAVVAEETDFFFLLPWRASERGVKKGSTSSSPRWLRSHYRSVNRSVKEYRDGVKACQEVIDGVLV